MPVRKSMSMADGRVSYLEWENDRPRLHFTHANGFNAQTYESLLQPLSERFHVTANDQRGHGFTELPAPEGFAKGWTIFRDDLIRLLERFDAGPVLLAGHSMGGVASLMAAAARPDLVAGLVLVEPVFLPAIAGPLLPFMRLMGASVPNIAERASKRRDTFDSKDAIAKSYRGRGAFAHWSDKVLEDYIAGGTRPLEDGRITLACPPHIEAACFTATPYGAYRYAGAVKCPLTLIHGDGTDSTCRPAQARAFAKRNPSARIVTVKGVGHFLPMERPEIVVEEINRVADRI